MFKGVKAVLRDFRGFQGVSKYPKEFQRCFKKQQRCFKGLQKHYRGI